MASVTTKKRALRDRILLLCPLPCLRPSSQTSSPQNDAVVDEGIALTVIPKSRPQQPASKVSSETTGVPPLSRAKTATQLSSSKLRRVFSPSPWRSETRILQYLKHPNIISCEDAYLFKSGSNPTEDTNRISDYGAYDLGTLQELSGRFRLANEKQHTQLYPPEPFVWHVLKSLLTAIVYMHTGHPTLGEFLSSTCDTVKHWMPIYHTDIRPENVLLKSSSSSVEYPLVTLSGFGSALPHAALNTKAPLNHSNSAPQLQDIARLIDTVKALCLSSPFDASQDMEMVPLPFELPAHYTHNLRVALYSHFNIHDTPRARLLALAKIVDRQASKGGFGFEALPEGILKEGGKGENVKEGEASLEVDGGWFNGSEDGEFQEVCLD